MKSFQLVLCMTLIPVGNQVLAETYKCMRGGRPVYQAKQCEVNSERGKLDIKADTPEEKAMAKEKLEAIKTEYDAKKTAKPQHTQQAPSPQQLTE